MRSALALLATIAVTGTPHHVTLMLDWTPNPDHVGFFYARDNGYFANSGLDVTIHAPSDPTAPLKLVAAGRVDFAVSYEQEVLIAVAKKLPVVAVAAVVPRPLNSIMAIDPKIRSVRDLKGRSIGITGVPADYAALDSALAAAGLRRAAVKAGSVGYNLLAALQRLDARPPAAREAGRRDACDDYALPSGSLPGLTASSTPAASSIVASASTNAFDNPRELPGSSVSPSSGYTSPSVCTPTAGPCNANSEIVSPADPRSTRRRRTT